MGRTRRPARTTAGAGVVSHRVPAPRPVPVPHQAARQRVAGRGDAEQVADLAFEAAGRVVEAGQAGDRGASSGVRSTSSTRWSSARPHEHVDHPEAVVVLGPRDQGDPVTRHAAGLTLRGGRRPGPRGSRSRRRSLGRSQDGGGLGKDRGERAGCEPDHRGRSERQCEREPRPVSGAVRSARLVVRRPHCDRGPCPDRTSPPRCAGRGRRRAPASARRRPPSPR